ncbi:hypothetical protein P7C71_g3585, partial [Lecanoromycetidae sp. Uapishka_2]
MALGLSLEMLRKNLGFSGPAGFWKIIAILFALLNLKSLPFAWHVSTSNPSMQTPPTNLPQLRLIKGMFAHIRSSRVRIASKQGPAALFQPMITSSRSGLLECDYNMHKSNSTYFSDFDVARLEILVSLCGSGIEQTRKELAKEMGTKEGFGIMLGGVNCNFRREIKPYEGFEMWTRLLSWDQKWFYGITHFVKKGAVKPEGYTLQPWRKTMAKKGSGSEEKSANGVATTSGPHPAIFASGIAKYVFKKGRLTIPPERVFRAAGLLPPRPNDIDSPPISLTPNPEGMSVDVAAASVAESLSPENAGEVMAASLTAKDDDGEWTWEKIEAERIRGLKIAHMFNGLDALNEEFMYEGKPVLGRY